MSCEGRTRLRARALPRTGARREAQCQLSLLDVTPGDVQSCVCFAPGSLDDADRVRCGRRGLPRGSRWRQPRCGPAPARLSESEPDQARIELLLAEIQPDPDLRHGLNVALASGRISTSQRTGWTFYVLLPSLSLARRSVATTYAASWGKRDRSARGRAADGDRVNVDPERDSHGASCIRLVGHIANRRRAAFVQRCWRDRLRQGKQRNRVAMGPSDGFERPSKYEARIAIRTECPGAKNAIRDSGSFQDSAPSATAIAA